MYKGTLAQATEFFGGTFHRLATFSALILVGALSGCALPGYSSGSISNDAWYDFGSNDDRATYGEQLSQEPIDYEPRVVQVTPALIRQQQRERASRTLGAAQEKISSGLTESIAYKVGVGDVLQIIVFGQPDLNNPTGTGGGGGANSASGQLVSADGTIYFPYAGEMKAQGLTLKQLRREISRRLSSYIRDPQVDVRVAQYRSQRVYISGDIQKPCTVPITDVSLTVLQALDQCDTFALQRSANSDNQGIGVQNVVLIRDGESTPLDLNQIYATGRPVPLQSGDRLLVDDSANRIFMVGEFSQQLALPYSTGGMSLNDAIADAGGVSLGTADTSAIYVVRGFVDSAPASDGGVKTIVRPNVYKLDASSVGGLLLANQFQLEPRDVVFAAPASLVNFNRALAQITPSLDILFQSFLLYDRASNN
ncbi:polysaccharide biosynthesis/export family protein [Salinisphaera aquimarina]|uniref:Polysaccharide biosynthesis/export family protein n=1 Tax=Salinisphaera aquimarina TaxID=2094031 RepID=A0ABV7ESE7_9GAMM